jgi:hypothetical protein
MPKVRALGNPDTRAATEARDVAEKLFKDKGSISRKIKALQDIAGYVTRGQFAAALGMEERRLRYIIDHPEVIKLDEAVCIQVLASKYGEMPVFDKIAVAP